MADNMSPEYGKTIDVAGLKANYLEEGTGDAVLLLHGAGPGVTSYANWRKNLPVFGKHFRTIAPDAPGFGHTERRDGQDYNMDFWAGHTLGLMDALGIEKANLVGNSFGGALTVALATRYPDRVKKFVLMGAGGLRFQPGEGVALVSAYQPDIDTMGRIMREFFAYDASIVSDDLVKSRFETSNLPGHKECYTSIFSKIAKGQLDLLTTPEDEIAKLKHEALVIHGREDKMVPLDCAFRYHDLLENSELHVFGKCGHWAQIEMQESFDKMVIDFFLR